MIPYYAAARLCPPACQCMRIDSRRQRTHTAVLVLCRFLMRHFTLAKQALDYSGGGHLAANERFRVLYGKSQSTEFPDTYCKLLGLFK